MANSSSSFKISFVGGFDIKPVATISLTISSNEEYSKEEINNIGMSLLIFFERSSTIEVQRIQALKYQIK